MCWHSVIITEYFFSCGLCYYAADEKILQFHDNSLRMMLLAPTTALLSILFYHSYYASGFIPHNYVSTLSLSFIHESGTLPSTDANPDNLGESAVSLIRDSAQNCCSINFSLLPLSHERSFQHHSLIASYRRLWHLSNKHR